jgi:hypothetical protein
MSDALKNHSDQFELDMVRLRCRAAVLCGIKKQTRTASFQPARNQAQSSLLKPIKDPRGGLSKTALFLHGMRFQQTYKIFTINDLNKIKVQNSTLNTRLKKPRLRPPKNEHNDIHPPSILDATRNHDFSSFAAIIFYTQ